MIFYEEMDAEMRNRNRQRKGMVLVLVLWILSLLSIFALAIGVGVRQKIKLVSRLEKRDEAHFAVQSGAQLARSLVAYVNQGKDFFSRSADEKRLFLNNPDLFKDAEIGNAKVDISYFCYDQWTPVKMYGVEDEERKLNINKATEKEMERLFIMTAELSQEKARDLADAILDWRSAGDQKIVGFYGDEYYSTLKFPYKPKRKNFEILDEARLVKGMNPEVFDHVKDFITVYGNGSVNVNTASRPVLLALGLPEKLVDSIIIARNGRDGIPGTRDDLMFRDDGISLKGAALAKIKGDNIIVLNDFFDRKIISTASHFFHAHVKATLVSGETRFVDCAIRGTDGKILAWREY